MVRVPRRQKRRQHDRRPAGRTIGARRLIIAGWVAYAAVYFGFALASEAWHAWALFMAYAVFYALTEPPEKTLVAELVPGERKGLAYGWYNFAIGVAAMPASVLFGYLYKDFGAVTAFSTGAGLAMLAAVLLLGVKTPGTMMKEEVLSDE